MTMAKTFTEKARALLLGSGDGGERPAVPASGAFIVEGRDETPDYAFRKLGGMETTNDLPEGFVREVIRWSNRLYDSHGLAEFIVDTVATLILGGGLQYTLQFERGFPAQYEKAIRDRVKNWWHHEDVDFEGRAHMFLQELLINGEHGWRFEVNPVNGFVRIGDIPREDVAGFETDAFDRIRIRSVTLATTSEETQPTTLRHLRKNPATKLLEGDCIYHRFKARATKRRGKPVLMNVVDELRSEKQFRLLGTDRALARLSVVMDTMLEGKSDEEVKVIAKALTTKLPTHARRLFHNEGVKNEFISANLEAGELVELMQYLVAVVMMSVGFPPSWAGIGEGANRSIAETQQDPAIRNRKREKDLIIRYFEKTVDFVIDRAIAAYIATELPGDKKIPVIDESGNRVERPLRECVTVNITPIPIENTDRDAEPLAATSAALIMLDAADAYEKKHGVTVYSHADKLRILNWAHKRDGVDIEVSPEMKTEDPRDAFGRDADPEGDIRPRPGENPAPGTPQNGTTRTGVPAAGQTAAQATPNTPKSA
jgi:hypothetical protein